MQPRGFAQAQGRREIAHSGAPGQSSPPDTCPPRFMCLKARKQELEAGRVFFQLITPLLSTP